MTRRIQDLRLSSRIIPKSDPLRALNALQNLVFALLGLHLRLGLAGLLARALIVVLAASSLSLLRRRLRLLGWSRLAHAAGRSGVGARDLGALERVPASAQGADVLVAEVEGDFVGVELD